MSASPQVVLVTGCSTGIGRALVRELHARHHRVYASARRLEALADLATDGIPTLALDVNDCASIQAAVAKLLAVEGRIDVLVNNAGVNLFGPVLELPIEQLRNVLDTNVLGLVAVTQAVFPHMADRRSGRIINIGSVVGLLPTPFAAGYCASKSAVHMLSEVMRMEVAPFGIDVVLVQPGGVKSSIAASGSREIERYKDPTSRYCLAFEGIRRRANASQDQPMSAEDFARELVDQALAAQPPRLIRLGTGSDSLAALAESPAPERDALMHGVYGLDKLDAAAQPQGRSHAE
jgi:NAD(P)-dependent dehydrogenase (short-subunit alcohol dehydrogenase family)